MLGIWAGWITAAYACPSDVVCVDAFPFVHASTTIHASSDAFDAYSCAPTTRTTGAEVRYQVNVSAAGFLAAALTDVAPGADVDVHLLRTNAATSCLRRGDARVGAFVEPGTYWVAIDTWTSTTGVEKPGAYRLSIALTRSDALVATGMSTDAARHSLRAYDVAMQRGEAARWRYSVIDFSLSSAVPRLWLLDLDRGAIRRQLYVAHGEGSSDPQDSRFAKYFSNTDGSHQSSLGMMRTAETYTGAFGGSLKLDGLERGYNHLVRSRAIVVHPWSGADAAYVERAGGVAPTWGCPGLDEAIAAEVIDELKGGTLMFSWYPDGDWSRNSAYLR